MNKPVLGIVVGGVLGAFDGLTALVSAPEAAPQIASIVVGSTFKGVIVGLIAGFFARKVNSLPLGIAVGLVVGIALRLAQSPPSPTPRPASTTTGRSCFPGTLAGAIVGYATQKFGRRPGAAVAALLLALSAVPALAQSAPAPDAQAAFDRLKTLVGDWDGHVTTTDGPAARVEFRLAGNGSALVERLFPGTDHEMVSVYHMAGSDLVLTHYCAMANQPRMKLVRGGREGELVFDFAGGDNVDPKTTVHMHGGRFMVKDKDSYEADWQVVGEGKPMGNNRFFMKRAAAAQ